MSREAIGGTFWRHPGWPNPVWVYDNAAHLSATHFKLGEMLAPNVPPIELRAAGSRRSGLGLIATTVGEAGGGPLILPSFYGSGAPVAANGATGGSSGGGGVMTSAPQPATSVTPVNPVFYDVSGNVITQAPCGSIYNMTVPGFEGQTLQVVQTKNGAAQFAGPMSIPMKNYASKCGQDEGTYNLQAFTQAGQLIGSTTFVVTPQSAAASSPTGLPPLAVATATPAAAPGTTSATTPLPAITSATAPAPVAAPSFFSTLTTTDWLVIAVLAVVILNQSSKGR